jgi:hypothetical protein
MIEPSRHSAVNLKGGDVFECVWEMMWHNGTGNNDKRMNHLIRLREGKKKKRNMAYVTFR